MEIETQISYGFVDLLNTFFEANKLEVNCLERDNYPSNLITLIYEDDSETAMSITLMSYRNLGFDNMLCDYLIKCGVPANRIAIGRVDITRNMKKLDEDWEAYRKTIGLK